MTSEPTPPIPRRRRSLYAASAAMFRWLHIYLSMLGFGTLMFFAFTGITLNHPTWFGAAEQTMQDAKGTLPEPLKKSIELPPSYYESLESLDYDPSADPPSYDETIDKLGIAEHLRSEHNLRGKVAEFRSDEFECMVVYKGPGYSADVFIDRATGDYTLSMMTSGAMAIMNDLHKGRDSGLPWKWVIDISAVLTMLLSLSGFGLLLYLRRRRLSGILTAVIGTVALIVVWAYFVP